MSIQIRPTQSGNIAVISPYNAAFVAGARNLSGKWGSITNRDGTTTDKAWIFPGEVAADVKALLREVYGTDGETPVETVRLRVTYDRSLDEGEALTVVVAGRQVARAFGRDSGARLGDLVVVRSGGFTSGGSRNNPYIVARADTVIDLLRLPRSLAERLIAEFPALTAIVNDDGSDLTTAPDNIIPFSQEG